MHNAQAQLKKQVFIEKKWTACSGNNVVIIREDKYGAWRRGLPSTHRSVLLSPLTKPSQGGEQARGRTKS